MRRLRRWLVNGILGLSLFLLAATSALWIRSESHRDSFEYYRPHSAFAAVSAGGRLLVSYGDLFSRDYSPRAGWNWNTGDDYSALNFVRYGFRYKHTIRASPGYSADYRDIVLPFWFLWMLFMAPIFLAIGSRWRRTRKASIASGNCCSVCGYDLRGTPGRCPECGTIRAKE
jgi:hypothetical protein